MRIYAFLLMSLLGFSTICGGATAQQFFKFGSSAKSAEGAAIKSANMRSGRAEGRISSCGSQSGEQQIVACIGSAMRAFAADVRSCRDIAAVAPQAAPAVTAAANEFAGATTKQAALSVLNRAQSVLRGLAAQSSGEARSVYNRINQAFQTAVGVLGSKV